MGRITQWSYRNPDLLLLLVAFLVGVGLGAYFGLWNGLFMAFVLMVFTYGISLLATPDAELGPHQ